MVNAGYTLRNVEIVDGHVYVGNITYVYLDGEREFGECADRRDKEIVARGVGGERPLGGLDSQFKIFVFN